MNNINDLLLEGIMETDAMEAELMEIELIDGLSQPTYTCNGECADSPIKLFNQLNHA